MYIEQVVNQKEMLKLLTDTLSQCSGELIAEICNKVLPQEITYAGDGSFLVKGEFEYQPF